MNPASASMRLYSKALELAQSPWAAFLESIPTAAATIPTMLFSHYSLLRPKNDRSRLRKRRMLHDPRAHFNVQLFLDLQFVDETLALDFETLDDTNPSIVHFCKSVQTQVFGSIVTQAASAYNSTIVSDQDDDDNDGLGGCEIIATSRVYDPEAEDVFGSGYFSLQVHVSQKVVVESTNQTLYLEVVQSVVEKGFDVVSGGQTEFRNHLYEDPLFRSVLSVTIRRGLTAPVIPPTLRPTARPTTNRPTKPPTMLPTPRPSPAPSRKPTALPTNMPSAKPSPRPTPLPTRLPSRIPSPHPSGFPTLVPSLDPSRAPSVLPSASPSGIPSMLPTRNPTQIPSATPTRIPASNVNFNSSQALRDRNSVLVASILGGSVVLATVSCLFCFLFYKYQTKSRRYSNFRSPVPLSQNHSHNFIPGIVEVGDDHESLDDTTLGDHTVGVGRKKKKRPSIRKGLGSSFDENSLYTTPFPLDEPEQRATAIPPPLPLQSVQSSLSSHLMTPLEYEERVVFPTLESLSDEEGVELEFPQSQLSNPLETLIPTQTNTRSSGPIDLDSSEPYNPNRNPIQITKIEPLTHPPISSLHENDDFSRIPSDLDVWSCDFEDFDRGSDFYKAEEHSTKSKSPSLSSSASTKRINNTFLPSSLAPSSLLVTGQKQQPQGLVSKSKLSSTVEKGRNPMPKIGANRKVATLPTASARDKDNNTSINGTNIQHISSIASRLKPGAKAPATPVVLMPNKSNGETKPRVVSPEESSLSSKKSNRSKKSTLSDMSKDTKTGAPTTAMDCLGSSGGLLVSSLKDGVTTINDSLASNANSLKDGAAPKIDSLSNGIVNSLRGGVPHIENLGNGLVSSLTDIFDRMAIPKITPEEYPESSPSLASESSKVAEKALTNDVSLVKTVSDDDSGVSASPWLMEKIENTLGPKSVHADLASLTSHKNLRKNQNGSEVSYGSRNTLGIRSMNHPNGSEVSYGSKRSYYNRNRNRQNGSEVSFGSRSSRYSQYSNIDVASIMSRASASMSGDILAQQTPEEISFVKTSRSALEEKKKRLEQQLAELDEHENNSLSNRNKDAASSVTMSSVTWGSFSTISARSRTFRDRRQVIVCVPPGRLGVILADQHDGNGTIINSIKSGSPVERILKPGDKLIAVDEIAVVDMSCSQITSLIASRADQERRFTVMTTVIKKNASNNEEATPTKKN